MATVVSSSFLSRSGGLAWWLAGIKSIQQNWCAVSEPSPKRRCFCSYRVCMSWTLLVLVMWSLLRGQMDLLSKLWFERPLMMPHTHQEGMKGFITWVMHFLGRTGWTPKLVQKWLEKVREKRLVWSYMVVGAGVSSSVLELSKHDLNLTAPKAGVPELSYQLAWMWSRWGREWSLKAVRSQTEKWNHILYSSLPQMSSQHFTPEIIFPL